jgi:small-conductance mechanosensitive channel
MASDTYYYFFSIILVLVMITHISNVTYFRIKNRTIIGNSYKPKSPEEQTLRRFSSISSLTVASVMLLIFIANLVFDVNHLIHLQNQSYARGLLVYAPIACLALFVLLFVYVINTFGRGKGRE